MRDYGTLIRWPRTAGLFALKVSFDCSLRHGPPNVVAAQRLRPAATTAQDSLTGERVEVRCSRELGASAQIRWHFLGRTKTNAFRLTPDVPQQLFRRNADRDGVAARFGTDDAARLRQDGHCYKFSRKLRAYLDQMKPGVDFKILAVGGLDEPSGGATWWAAAGDSRPDS